jgi:glycosyltransferase involved in cell wall biosynthesis
LCAALTKGFSSSLIAISEPVAESWRAAGLAHRKIVLIPNGVNAKRFHPVSIDEMMGLRKLLNLPIDRQILLWIGRLDIVTKGLDRLCEILGLLDEKYYVVIVGDGPGRKYLQERIITIGAQERTIYIGSVGDTAHYYQSADALLFTSRREPMGLVILEAAAAGLPIFALPCEGGARYLLQEVGAMSVQSDEAKVLAGLMNEARLVRRSLGEIRTLTAKYSWEVCARRGMDVYAEALRSSYIPATVSR